MGNGRVVGGCSGRVRGSKGLATRDVLDVCSGNHRQRHISVLERRCAEALVRTRLADLRGRTDNLLAVMDAGALGARVIRARRRHIEQELKSLEVMARRYGFTK